MITANTNNIIQTFEKTPTEFDEFEDWITNHCMQVLYIGNLKYYIEGDEDAVLFKLAWGI